MKLGICTRYTSHEAAFAAIRLADAAEELGMDVEIMTMTEEPAKLCPRWDRRVLRATAVPFSRWALQLDHVVWTTVPHFQQIEWVRKQEKRTTIFLLWNEIDKSHSRSLGAAHQLICPSNACFELMTHSGFRNTRFIPWDCGYPFHKKPESYQVTQPKVLLPLWDGNARKLEMSLLSMVDECLWESPDVSFTLVCNSSTITSRAMRGFNDLSHRYKRMTVVRNVLPGSRFRFFQSHDLTLCPFHFDNFGMTALQSIEMGTPVIGFSVSPLDEFMHIGNSVLVNCQQAYNTMNVPHAIPDYPAMEKLLVGLLHDKHRLRTLQESTLVNAESRRALFSRRIKAALLC